MTETRNSVWIPAVFTLLYVGSAWYIVNRIQVSDTANPGGWFQFGAILALVAIVHVPLSIFLLWALYGALWMRKPEMGRGSLVMASLLCPLGAAVILACGLRLLHVI